MNPWPLDPASTNTRGAISPITGCQSGVTSYRLAHPPPRRRVQQRRSPLDHPSAELRRLVRAHPLVEIVRIDRGFGVERTDEEQLVAFGSEVVAVREIAVGGYADVVAPRERRDDVAFDRERQLGAHHRGEALRPGSGGDQDAFGGDRVALARRKRPRLTQRLDRRDASVKRLGAELAGAFEHPLGCEHGVGVAGVALEGRDRDPVEIEGRPFGHDLLGFEQVGRDALLVQAWHDLAYGRLVLGWVEHEQTGLAEPRRPTRVLLEVPEHPDRVACDRREEGVGVVRADDRARTAGGSARGGRPFDHDGSNATAREVERDARTVHARADHGDVERRHDTDSWSPTMR